MSLIVQSGSKQYHLEAGQKFLVDRLVAEPDSVISLNLIYAFGVDAGLKEIKAKVIRHLKGEKIRVVKFKSKSNYHRQYGHRSYLTELQVEGEFIKPLITEKVEVKTKKTATVKTEIPVTTKPKKEKVEKTEKAVKPLKENAPKATAVKATKKIK